MTHSMESEAFSWLLLLALVSTFASSARLNQAIFLSIDVSTGEVPAGEGLLDDKSHLRHQNKNLNSQIDDPR